MNGMVVELSDRTAEEYNEGLVNSPESFVNRVCYDKRIEKGYFDLDMMFDGWTKEDFDFVSEKNMRIILEAFGKQNFLVDLSSEQSASINLYFGLLKMKEAETQDMVGIMKRITHLHEIAEKLIEERDQKSREKEKIQKEKDDLERRLKEVNEKRMAELKGKLRTPTDTTREEELLKENEMLKSELEKIKNERESIIPSHYIETMNICPGTIGCCMNHDDGIRELLSRIDTGCCKVENCQTKK